MLIIDNPLDKEFEIILPVNLKSLSINFILKDCIMPKISFKSDSSFLEKLSFISPEDDDFDYYNEYIDHYYDDKLDNLMIVVKNLRPKALHIDNFVSHFPIIIEIISMLDI
jgi:hypothetical protein